MGVSSLKLKERAEGECDAGATQGGIAGMTVFAFAAVADKPGIGIGIDISVWGWYWYWYRYWYGYGRYCDWRLTIVEFGFGTE